ncbi:unnamed protein product [Kuraishia capsulata CBS 1993]|uniref:Enoyl reductase (ER) domain-containing protein n=1 Tax=Kuraishia capsulata CBS 1993 TaxID=1382522 RepID=W6MPP4_9ASCO|nr:uncharacterized protein KUCA_T00003099001 [Kuraishia capsulata CBS 1993]CDK27122.1 unnamed protein product [Kuraishia capsulata CBS 1993]
MPENRAAHITAFKETAKLKVDSAPYPSVTPDTIVVRNRAVATNPVDWILLKFGFVVKWLLKLPYVGGEDSAGEVVEVGNSVSNFKIGDRVFCYCTGLDSKINNPAYGSFQLYSLIDPKVATLIPDELSFSKAAVLPLGLATAAAALFGQTNLAMDYPTLPHARRNGQVVIIWGGSTSVGLNAIQLAVAAGYEVYSTCSPKNFDLLKSLGASHVYDYRDVTAVQEIVSQIGDKNVVGAVAIKYASAEKCYEILKQVNCPSKIVAVVSLPVSDETNVLVISANLIVFALKYYVFQWSGVKLKKVNALDARLPDISEKIFHDYVPKALASGDFVASPEPIIIGNGLDNIQTALEFHKKGVSAAKVVVTLED